MSATTATDDDILLTCTPGREADHLTFDYSVTNQSSVAAYVMDVLPKSDPATGRFSVDPDAVSVWLALDGMLRISKGMPLMPEGTEPQAHIMPLAVKLGPGERLTRRLLHPIPLAEHSPAIPCGNLREYLLKPIVGVALMVDVIRADAPGFIAARAAGFPKAYFRLSPIEDDLVMHHLVCSFRSRGLHALVRIGDYPRPV